MKRDTANYAEALDADDRECLYTVDEFMANVRAHSFMDHDGFGVPAKGDLKDFRNIDGWIYPSACPDAIPADATHICWYNK